MTADLVKDAIMRPEVQQYSTSSSDPISTLSESWKRWVSLEPDSRSPEITSSRPPVKKPSSSVKGEGPPFTGNGEWLSTNASPIVRIRELHTALASVRISLGGHIVDFALLRPRGCLSGICHVCHGLQDAMMG